MMEIRPTTRVQTAAAKCLAKIRRIMVSGQFSHSIPLPQYGGQNSSHTYIYNFPAKPVDFRLWASSG